jgi:hypothetical protein
VGHNILDFFREGLPSHKVVLPTLALYLRSVCMSNIAFRGLRCHPPTCMLLKLRLVVDSIPSALTILFNNLPNCHFQGVP